MAALSAELRSIFEREVVQARDTAEAAARAALTTLAVERDRPFDSMIEERRALRRSLRARARQLGEGDLGAGMPRLIEEIAYEQWHRMLFARFLAENELLMHPEGVAVTLEECAELAQEEGAEDLWAVATQYASLMLPGIFRVDDPALQVRFAPEGRHRLEQIVTDLPQAVFISDDGLGWAYQFWQGKKKDEVNASERKIGGADIAPVTQLFTEDYMVKFLLHNTLGAWWAYRHSDSPLNKTFEYLRYREDGTPAAGTFGGWPNRVAEVTMMDPCGGSGHFVVAAFEMFARMRMEEEGLCAAEAGDAVIRDNVHMLEIDLRCTQIAVFNLSLAAWKSGGYRNLPQPNIACSGMPVQGQLEEWAELIGKDNSLNWILERLYNLFLSAPNLGSLINPADIQIEERMFVANYGEIEVALLKAIEETEKIGSYHHKTSGLAVQSATKAASLLSGRYTLVATNVPYLSGGKQVDSLQAFCEQYYSTSRRDLATVFIERCKAFTDDGCSYALVAPQNWIYLDAYKGFREKMLRQQTWTFLARLGRRAFRALSGEIVNAGLFVFSNSPPPDMSMIWGIDLEGSRSPSAKESMAGSAPILCVSQAHQLNNPDMRVIFGEFQTGKNLGDFADSHHGQGSFDDPCYAFRFWEMDRLMPGWILQQTTGTSHDSVSGCSNIFRWENGEGMLRRYMDARAEQGYSSGKWRAGVQAWGKLGVAVSGLRNNLYINRYSGESFDTNVTVLLPKKPDLLGAIWHFCQSEEFLNHVLKIDGSLKIRGKTYLKVPFDLQRWQSMAEEQGFNPNLSSTDPTQWQFDGIIAGSPNPLHVAITQLLGFRWPNQVNDGLDRFVDEDGIVCIPSVSQELAATERVRAVLAAAFEPEWSMEKQRALLKDVGFHSKTISTWLKDGFFSQHCRLFRNRPFIWHIWDGRKDGFSALVNYHKLDHAKLERLIYTYLGDWINTQRAEQEQGEAGAEGRLVAALELKKKLELILEGEPPYDIYVRWKPLHEQPIGWNPDLNDGVRLNIRPFVTAGVLRSKFTIHWKKDRGKNPDGSERHNDLHFTWAQKEEARRQAGVL